MPTSVRLDSHTKRLLELLATRKSSSKSQVIREAIAALARKEELERSAESPYQRISDLVGCVSGGPRDLSVETGRRFRELLEFRRESRNDSG